MIERSRKHLRRIALAFCTLVACAASQAAESVFIPAEPITAEEPSPYFRFDESTFSGASARSSAGQVLQGLPIPGFTERAFKLVAPNNSLSAGGIKIEIVEEGGSRFLDFPEIHQIVAESETNPGDRVGLYEIGGRYYGTALVDGIVHELLPVDDADGEQGLYQFRTLTDEDAPAPGWCGTEATPESIAQQMAIEAAAGDPKPIEFRGARSSAVADREVDFAIEGAYEYTSRFPDPETAANYILAVMAEVNNIYIRDVQTQFRITHLRMWATDTDPYIGISTSNLLVNLMGHISSSAAPASLKNADLAHILSADDNGGGYAMVDTLCNVIGQNAAASSVKSTETFPNTGYTWTVDVMSHEIGHNFGSNHTHCYAPPIDYCWGIESGCFSGSFVRSDGTLMSYCHLSSSTRLQFHQRVINVLRSRVLAASCLATVPTSPIDVYEDDNTVDHAKPLSMHNWQSHSIFPAGDVDWTTINLPAWAGVVLRTEGASGDTVLTLYDQYLNVLTTSDDISGSDLFSRIELTCATGPLAPGRYYVRVEEKGNDATISDYKLSFEPDFCFEDQYEPDNSFAEATPIELGTVQQHNMLPQGDGDYFKFTLTAPTNFVVRADHAQYIWYQMFLYNSSFEQIDEGVGNSSFGTPCLLNRNCSSAPTPAGTYYLKVFRQGYAATGDYTFRFYPCTPKANVTLNEVLVADGSGPIDFGASQPGLAQPTRTFKVRNYGDSTLNLSALTVPPGYNIVEGLSASIPSSGFDNFTIELPTSTEGVFAGSVSFTTNDPSAPSFDFAVTGEIRAQAPEVSAFVGAVEVQNGGGPVDLGRVALGEPAASRTITVRNQGPLTLNTFNLSVTPPFTISEGLDNSIPATTSATETKVSSASTELLTGVNTFPITFTTPGPITDVSVTLNIRHMTVSFLTIRLFHPDGGGAFTTLFPNLGGSGDDLTETTFTDSAATAIADGTPPYTGSFRPSTPFSVMNGRNAAGTYTLQIIDPVNNGQQKFLDSYSVTIKSGSVGQDSFTVQLPTGTSGDFTGAVTFDCTDADENPFTIPVIGSVNETPTLTAFTVAGGAIAQSANPAPFSFAQSGTFPATSIEISETADFASFSSIAVPGGPNQFTFTSGVSGPRTLYARLRNSAGVGNVRSTNTIFDNQPPIYTNTSYNQTEVGGTMFFNNPYTATDQHSGVKDIDIWVIPPGGTWQYVSTTPATGNFFYTPTAGAGIYVFGVVLRDIAGNSTPVPTSTVGKSYTMYSPVANGPFPHYFPSPVAGPYRFPMSSGRGVVINFANPPTAGVVTVQRYLNSANTVGLDPASLVNLHWSIEGSGGFNFTSANITFEYEEAALNGIVETTELNTAYRVSGSTVTTFPGTVTEFTNLFDVTGVTGFSDWYIGKTMPSSTMDADWEMY